MGQASRCTRDPAPTGRTRARPGVGGVVTAATVVAGLFVAGLVVAGLVVAGLVVASLGAGAGSGHRTSLGPPPSQLPAQTDLPGDAMWMHGTSAFIFGTNDSIEYGSPDVDTLASVHSDLKEGKLTLMRTWAYATDPDRSILGRLATIKASGMQCMMMLGSPGHLAWLEHVVALAGDACDIYELGNEPDNSVNASSVAQTVKEWNAAIPALRRINPRAAFGGPAVQYPTSSDGSQGSYPSDIAYFLAQTAASGVRADFISYHHYPCNGYTSQSKCLADTPATVTSGYRAVLGWEQRYYGRTIPTGLSEYNFDPGSATLYRWGRDGRFLFQWTEVMLTTLVTDRVAFANQFTTLNWSGYGLLDMFADAAPHAPKPQYYGMVDVGERYGSGSTVPIPPGG